MSIQLSATLIHRFNIGALMEKGLTFKAGQTPVQLSTGRSKRQGKSDWMRLDVSTPLLRHDDGGYHVTRCGSPGSHHCSSLPHFPYSWRLTA
jgi:hypothetical protein